MSKEITLKAELVEDRGRQKFYRLNRLITKGIWFGKIIDLEEAIEEELENIKPEWKKCFKKSGFDLICISDASTHLERLVFGAIEKDGQYDRSRIQIDGCLTMSIHGGDAKSMKPAEVYLRRLNRVNQ